MNTASAGSSLPIGDHAKLSVILAAYDEEATIAEVIDSVLAVSLPDRVELELIIVESNSSDDTRDLVSKYTDPRVSLVLQDEPRGKGHAVRQGLRHVTGDIVLIQDGDLEYSVADYPALIEPILQGRTQFVLGSRHVKGRPMRDFADAKLTSRILNAGHWIFTGLFNLLYGTRLRDPFTMYKVFRTECIHGLEFVANRFDFDYELVAKLVRRGYQPLEVPVIYHSRGFDAGKKVRPIRDPLTWIVALFRFRFSKLEASDANRGETGASG
ncbi:MAG: glycosyltransferase family 2 protein [Acidimicrobiia bacterium]|nr:glycosyltransferase family 2 protein [Acidimicrobiia bacterium]